MIVNQLLQKYAKERVELKTIVHSVKVSMTMSVPKFYQLHYTLSRY